MTISSTRASATEVIFSMGQPHEVQYWTRHLGVSRDELRRTVDKVGNSAAAVRKELGLLGRSTNNGSPHGASPTSFQFSGMMECLIP